jgi:hypothetical protein
VSIGYGCEIGYFKRFNNSSKIAPLLFTVNNQYNTKIINL